MDLNLNAMNVQRLMKSLFLKTGFPKGETKDYVQIIDAAYY